MDEVEESPRFHRGVCGFESRLRHASYEQERHRWRGGAGCKPVVSAEQVRILPPALEGKGALGNNNATREEDRPWPTSGTESECPAVGPVLR